MDLLGSAALQRLFEQIVVTLWHVEW
jgi:hypothetical protein